MPNEICCIGHVTLDHVITPVGTQTMPGGTAFYFSHAIAGTGVSSALVTSLGERDRSLLSSLEQRGLSISVLPSANTVVFENRYGENPNLRTQRVLQTADPFPAAALQQLRAKIFHLGPLLAGDFTLDGIKALAKNGTLSLDVQGFLRKVVGQSVVAIDWKEKAAILPFVHYLKASEEEMQVLTGTGKIEDGARTLAALGAKEVIITLGSKGSVVFDGTTLYSIPAFVPSATVDATGCGDTYMAGYLSQRASGAGIQAAGEFAAAMASCKMARSGPFTGAADEVNDVLQSGKKTLDTGGAGY